MPIASHCTTPPSALPGLGSVELAIRLVRSSRRRYSYERLREVLARWCGEQFCDTVLQTRHELLQSLPLEIDGRGWRLHAQPSEHLPLQRGDSARVRCLVCGEIPSQFEGMYVRHGITAQELPPSLRVATVCNEVD